ncbi:hypothetical protein [Flavobacterium sp.]|uniref:hypothetical protein n=1 Tax=Flavobacterium sp. TaxID=239 RepID=UPI0022BB73CB|nr:hypothetical protein [Flavobacterium sp.]MCZ8090287.1 hypothetical protein [Flavobacterium sp.]
MVELNDRIDLGIIKLKDTSSVFNLLGDKLVLKLKGNSTESFYFKYLFKDDVEKKIYKNCHLTDIIIKYIDPDNGEPSEMIYNKYNE